MATYINLFRRNLLTESKTRNEHPKITAGGTNVTINLSPLDGNNWKNKNKIPIVNTNKMIWSRYLREILSLGSLDSHHIRKIDIIISMDNA
jgi:hypothetical protein